MQRLSLFSALALAVACANSAQSVPAVAQTSSRLPIVSDTSGEGLIPAGYGSLKQDEIAIKLQPTDLLIKLIPLDENVIRTLSADSWKSLHDIAASKAVQIARMASQRGYPRLVLFYVSFYGLAPDARFSPLELNIGVAGRDFRPIDIIPLSNGFGSERVQPRETQSALFLFDPSLDIEQPILVTFGTERTSSWSTTLQNIIRERTVVRSRAAADAKRNKP